MSSASIRRRKTSRSRASTRRPAGLAIDYRGDTAEALADAGEKFDLVLAMEVVEHVADLELFVAKAAEMVKPGGLMIGATINRTFKSFGLAIVAAEYVLGWVPRGTHSWDKFVTPEEFETAMRAGGLQGHATRPASSTTRSPAPGSSRATWT